MPVARVSVINGASESKCVSALIDTGSAYNLVAMTAAKTILGMTEHRIMSEGKVREVRPLDGKNRKIFGWKVDMRIKCDSTSTTSLVLREIWIYVMEETHPDYPVLIGQDGSFEERVLRHHNRAANQFWELRE